MLQCRNMTIANSRHSRVDWCDSCQMAHLHLPGLTLHLERERLQALQCTLQQAVVALAGLDAMNTAAEPGEPGTAYGKRFN